MNSGINKSINQTSENLVILVKTLMLVLVLTNPFMSIGQNKEDRDLIVKNTLYSQYDLAFEMLSINYERNLLLTKENIPFLLSIGISHTTLASTATDFIGMECQFEFLHILDIIKAILKQELAIGGRNHIIKLNLKRTITVLKIHFC